MREALQAGLGLLEATDFGRGLRSYLYRRAILRLTAKGRGEEGFSPLPDGVRPTGALAADPRRPGRLYLGGEGGLWIGEDGGVVWTRAFGAEERIVDVEVHAEGGRRATGPFQGSGRRRKFRALDPGCNLQRMTIYFATNVGGYKVAVVCVIGGADNELTDPGDIRGSQQNPDIARFENGDFRKLRHRPSPLIGTGSCP